MPNRHLRQFYDSTAPENIPAGSLAAVYVNASGSFAWTQAEVDRMRAVIGISESSDPEWMHFGRCVAMEPGAADVAGVINCLRKRRELGHDDGMVYCDRSDWPTIEQACIDNNEHPEWWIAAPGFTVQEAIALRSEHRHKQPVAVQTEWHSGYDLSVITGHLTFTPARQFKATG